MDLAALFRKNQMPVGTTYATKKVVKEEEKIEEKPAPPKKEEIKEVRTRMPTLSLFYPPELLDFEAMDMMNE